MAILIAFGLAFGVPAATIPWARPVVFSVGVALMPLGTALRWYAIRALGRYFTRDVAVRAGQQVVHFGPYRLIRHPSYTGSLVSVLGLGLALTNWASVLAAIAIPLVGYAYRVRVEERALVEALGQLYVEYMARTKRFVPFVF